MIIDNKTAKKLKEDFPIFKSNPNLIYLDNAATSQRPKQVLQSMVNFYEKENANPGRSTHALAEKSMMRYSEARETVARFLNSEPEEIIFTKNATDSINIVSHLVESLLKSGKNEILLTEMEHHSNLVPWQQLAKRRNMKLVFVKIKSDFTLDYEDAKKKIANNTAVLAFTYTSNVLGTVNDVKLLTGLARQKGATSVIDAAQAVQHMKINVKDLGCDFLAFSSHKMLGPGGIGVLYGRRELLEKVQPCDFGGGMIEKVTLQDSMWRKAPERFEAGTQNVAGAVGLAEAIRYIEKIGIKNIHEWEQELTKYTKNKLLGIGGIKLYSGINSSSIVSFNLNKIHPHDVAELLNRVGIAVRAGHMCAMPLMSVLGVEGGVCRASFSFHNTFEDVDKLVETLKKIVERFK